MSTMGCEVCKSELHDEPSCESFAGFTKVYKEAGQCLKCNARFCSEHCSYTITDDDVGTLGVYYYCLACTKQMQEKYAADMRQAADWWDTVPCVGFIVAYFYRWLVA